MSKYAKINLENIVENIIVCEDSQISTLSGNYIKETENTNRAEIGYEYSLEKNKFKAHQPYESWTLNEETLIWEAPVQIPEGAEISPFGTVIGYRWDEDSQGWISLL